MEVVMKNSQEMDCPHCGQKLDAWDPGDESGWDHDLLVCNNSKCEYFVRGRKKISDECEVNFAYRYCYDPVKDRAIAIATWCGGDLSLRKGRAVQ
jgi:hypothetical protein